MTFFHEVSRFYFVTNAVFIDQEYSNIVKYYYNLK